MTEQLKLILEALKEYNALLNVLNKAGKETVELLEAHIKDLEN